MIAPSWAGISLAGCTNPPNNPVKGGSRRIAGIRMRRWVEVPVNMRHSNDIIYWGRGVLTLIVAFCSGLGNIRGLRLDANFFCESGTPP